MTSQVKFATRKQRFLTCEVIDFCCRPSDFWRRAPAAAPVCTQIAKPSRWDMPRTGRYLLALLVSAVLAIPAFAQDASLPIGEKTMLDPQTLADRYVAVWNEKDEERRRAAIASLWVPNGQHFVEGRQARGYEELEKRIRGSHEKNVRDDGNRFRAAPGARRLPGVVTFYWEMLPADADTVLVRGLEFLILNDDGRILVDYQFFPA